MQPEVVQKIWQATYDSFEATNRSHHTAGGVLFDKAQANDIQFRLMGNIPKLKDGSEEIKQQVAADVQLCETLGLVTQETSAGILALLEES